MKRVSSRQRLVSWDAFDARLHEDSSADGTSSFATAKNIQVPEAVRVPHDVFDTQSLDSNSSHEFGVVTTHDEASSSLKRKRTPMSTTNHLGTANVSHIVPLPPHRIPNWDNGVQASSLGTKMDGKLVASRRLDSSSCSSAASMAALSISSNDDSTRPECECCPLLEILNEDVQLRTFQYLTLQDLQALSQVSRDLHHMLVSPDSNHVWEDVACRRQWDRLLCPKTRNISKKDEESAGTHHAAMKTDIATSSTLRNEWVNDLRFPAPFAGVSACKVPSKPFTFSVACMAPTNPQCSRKAHAAVSSVRASSWPSPVVPWNALFQLSTTHYPSAIDSSIFTPSRWQRTMLRTRDHVVRVRRITLAKEFHYITVGAPGVVPESEVCPATPYQQAVQFTGEVGQGDRCIRANHPFAVPKDQKPSLGGGRLRWMMGRMFAHQRSFPGAASSPRRAPAPQQLLNRLRRTRSNHSDPDGDNSIVQEEEMLVPARLCFRPFVVPFCLSRNKTTNVQSWCLTPRLVHYFEATIWPVPSSENDESASFRSTRGGDNDFLARFRTHRRHAAECVAVGLSTSNFAIHSRMPGWDEHSYGYHGDDGGIFHAQGQMVRSYGPTYGAGDVVGCGLDFARRCIFFTLNGQYLGTAFRLSLEDLQEPWYPTVGIDTQCPVQCNFGQDPFAFDLQEHICQQAPVVEKSLFC